MTDTRNTTIEQEAIKLLKAAFVRNGKICHEAATGEFVWGLCKLVARLGTNKIDGLIAKLKDYNPAEVTKAHRGAGSTARPKLYADQLAQVCCMRTA